MIDKREMNGLGIDMPLLGMGLMRLPMNGDVVDDQLAIPMVDEMYNACVRYFYTAYVYMNGESERFAKRALTDRYPRDQFYITSKLPGHLVKSPEDAERVFSESCERMGVDYIDFYLLHGIDYNGWKHFRETGCDQFQRKLKEDGRIRYAGFSFHGSPDDLRAILAEQPDWDFIQLQVNYYDWYADTAKELYETVTGRGIPLVIMEPVRGGGLFNLGDDVRELFTAHDPEASNAEWAMRWIGSREGVNVVLSGVSTLEQARENVRFYAPLRPLDDAEESVVRDVVELIRSRPLIPCTGCNYCSVCPMDIDIRTIFRAANDNTQLHDGGKAVWSYFCAVEDGHRADNCIRCWSCVQHCPQHIDIPNELARVHEMLTALRDAQA